MEITPTLTLPAVPANTLAANLLNKLQENIPESDRNFSPGRATTTERPEGLESFETLKGYLNRIKNKTSKPLRPPFKRPSLRPNKVTTEASVPREEEKEEIQHDYRANLFGRRNLLKQKISSSISRTQIIEPTVPTVTEVSSSEEIILEPSIESSLVVNVASNVRVEGEDTDLRTSVLTVFLSGKVPGVFSTSLKTVILSGEEETGRQRRAAEEILPTMSLDTGIMTTTFWTELESSINS